MVQNLEFCAALGKNNSGHPDSKKRDVPVLLHFVCTILVFGWWSMVVVSADSGITSTLL